MVDTALFVGIDLAWQSNKNPSGAAVLRGGSQGVELQLVSSPVRSYNEIRAFLASVKGSEVVVAIDGPLVMNNPTGMRSCEREVSRAYGSRHASCHASNLGLYPDPSSVRLAHELVLEGFSHPEPGCNGKTVLEVYPHAGFVALFDLPRVIRYKKGRAADKVAGLRMVQHVIRGLSVEEAPLRHNSMLTEFLSRDPASLRGVHRKEYEDALDAVFCAYLAYYFWRFGIAQSEMFGNVTDGYIVNPKLRTGYKRPAAA